MKRRWHNFRKSLLRSAMPMLRTLPPQTATRWVGRLGVLEYNFLPGLRDKIEAAIRREADRFGEPWDIPAVSRAFAANQMRSWARDLLVDGLDDDGFRQMFRVVGQEHLDEAYNQKRGVVLLGNHYGVYLLTACWLLRNGYPWRMFAERPRNVSRMLQEHFALSGTLGQDKLFISRRANPAEAAAAILRAARVLKAGMTLSVAADVRWSGPLTGSARFLGRTHRFSSTWINLAAMTGAPVLPNFCRITPDGIYEVEFQPSFQLPTDAKDPGRADVWVQHAMSIIEERVRLDPSNSYEYFFWREIEQQVELARAS